MNESSRIQQHNNFPSQIPQLFPKSTEPKQNQNQQTLKTHHVSAHQCDEEHVAGEIFGVILSRSRSVSSAPPSRESHKAEKQRGLMQTMKRSFSVSGGYCRIHDQHDIINDDMNNPNDVFFQKRTVKKKGKILKACMRLLGL